MQMSSSQFTRWARLCSAFAMASLVFVLLGLAGCGGSTTTEQNCTKIASVTNPSPANGVLSHTGGASFRPASDLSTSLSARQAFSPSVPHIQYRLGFWEQGIIAVGVVADTSANLPTNSSQVIDLLNKTLPFLPSGLKVTAGLPQELQHLPSFVHGSTVATAFLQLQKRNAAGAYDNDFEDDDLKTAINAINTQAQSAAVPTSGAVIVGASPDWIMDGGSGGDFVGGHPDGPPTPLKCASATAPANSSLGAGSGVYVLDTTDPLAPMGSSTTPGYGAGHTGGTGPVASTLCPPPNPPSACQLVTPLDSSVDEVDAHLPDENAYIEAYHTLAKSSGLTDASFREHGLFVSGIIHYVAPGASITLRRVLNDQGVGDMATLLDALTWVLQVSKEPKPIVNLSLSVEPPPSCLIAIWQSKDQFPRGDPLSSADYPPYTLPDGSIDPSMCHNDPLVDASDSNAPNAPLYDNRLFVPLGIVVADTATRATIVAAAGNDSTANAHIGPDMPADVCGVTAVAALDSTTGALADFSNIPQGHCLDFATSLSALANNPTGVTFGGAVSGVTAPGVNICSVYAQPASGSGAAIWGGTSFATAFVSGQKAGGNNPGQPCNPTSATHTCSSRLSSTTTTCTVTLMNDIHAPSKFNWTASSTPAGATFAPSSGTVAPGESANVTVSIPNSSCPVKISFTDASSKTTLSFALDSSCR